MSWIVKNKKTIGFVVSIIFSLLQNIGALPTAAQAVSADTKSSP